MERYDVAVCGAGPVGLGLALELGLRGVRVLLLEKETSTHQIPKGQSLTNRTLEHFRAWGVEDAVRAGRTLPKGFPIGNVTAYRDLTSPYWYYQEGGGPGRGASVVTLFDRPPERLPQYATEAALRNRLGVLPNVTVKSGWRLVDARDVEGGVGVEVEAVAHAACSTLSCAYLVGADGARSSVRAIAEISSTVQRLGDRMVLLVFRSPEFETEMAKFPATTTVRILKPELRGHWQFFGRVDARDTWFFHAPVPAGTTLSSDALVELLHTATGLRFAVDIEHAGFWDLRVSIADHYRRGRIFIAGDACHSHPPYGGFGLNNGLEDARNLGWKLAAVLQGWGGPDLLDSYEAERRPVFVQTAREMIVRGITRERDFLDAYDPTRDRAAFEAAWRDIPHKTELGSYLPHYAGSPIVAGGGDRSPGIDGDAAVEARPGQHLAPAGLTNGRSVFEGLRGGYHLLAFGAPEAAAAFRAAAARLQVPFAVTEDTFADGRIAYGCRLILVRPDEYVAWVGQQAPDDIEALLRAVLSLT